jgi:uncharacterized cysteine cluster protein YcgN (CxxCxxCC family)
MPAFYETKTLLQMTPEEWESLCDGCGKCCVLKLEDVDTGIIYSTDVGCKLLDCRTARCSDYHNRKEQVPDCVVLTPETLENYSWMPESCAYRRLSEGRGLPDWHPLISGSYNSVIAAGHSVAGQIFPEASVDEADMADHITDWDKVSSLSMKDNET